MCGKSDAGYRGWLAVHSRNTCSLQLRDKRSDRASYALDTQQFCGIRFHAELRPLTRYPQKSHEVSVYRIDNTENHR